MNYRVWTHAERDGRGDVSGKGERGEEAGVNEQEWLMSDNPATMLTWLFADPTRLDIGAHRFCRPSDRKLRLWVEACRQLANQDDRPWGNYDLGMPNSLLAACERWMRCNQSVMPVDPLPARASLLREIISNPFRPTALPCFRRLTQDYPIVLSLASAAYEEWAKKCGQCQGTGVLDRNPIGGPEPDDDKLYVLAPPAIWPCPNCLGKGCLDGVLDPVRLAILADALEEAGCDNEDILFHLRGVIGCDLCEGAGTIYETPALSSWRKRPRCEGVGLVSPGPHVRGCWVLDLILGRE